MRLDDENGMITPRGWLMIAFCVILFCAAALWAVVTLIVKLWALLVTL
jgi:uncharacterized membrane protein YqhA